MVEKQNNYRWRPVTEIGWMSNLEEKRFHLYVKCFDPDTDRFIYSVINECRFDPTASGCDYGSPNHWRNISTYWRVISFFEYPSAPEAQ